MVQGLRGVRCEQGIARHVGPGNEAQVLIQAARQRGAVRDIADELRGGGIGPAGPQDILHIGTAEQAVGAQRVRALLAEVDLHIVKVGRQRALQVQVNAPLHVVHHGPGGKLSPGLERSLRDGLEVRRFRDGFETDVGLQILGVGRLDDRPVRSDPIGSGRVLELSQHGGPIGEKARGHRRVRSVVRHNQLAHRQKPEGVQTRTRPPLPLLQTNDQNQSPQTEPGQAGKLKAQHGDQEIRQLFQTERGWRDRMERPACRRSNGRRQQPSHGQNCDNAAQKNPERCEHPPAARLPLRGRRAQAIESPPGQNR